MILTKEQQAILNGEKGETLAKVMKTLVLYGETFGARLTINGTEAALLVQNALDLTVSTNLPTGKENDGDLPVWALTAITAMSENGIPLTEDSVTRATASAVLYQVNNMNAS